MATTWEVKVLHQHAEAKTTLVAGSITEGGITKTYEVSAPINTQVEKDAVYDGIWAKHQADLPKEITDAKLIANLIEEFETKGKTNLEARE